MILTVTDMHTAGEPVRIVTGGYPRLEGRTILDKRREARERHDHLRRALMLEPRGHSGMYGVIPVEPSRPEAVMGALFTHGEGYSTMCGHATIALGRWLVESGRVPAVEGETRFALELPCGVVSLTCEVENGRVLRTTFESVPAFASRRDLIVEVAGYGPIRLDLAYGGAFYAILPSSALGLDFRETPLPRLTEAAVAVTEAVRRSVPITHPQADDLGFLYGTILTDDAPPPEPTSNLCVFAEGQIDRSPTGSGVTARMALDHARGAIAPWVERLFRGPTRIPFSGRVVGQAGPPDGAVTVAVSGTSAFSGEATFRLEANDPLAHGFGLPPTFGHPRSGTWRSRPSQPNASPSNSTARPSAMERSAASRSPPPQPSSTGDLDRAPRPRPRGESAGAGRRWSRGGRRPRRMVSSTCTLSRVGPLDRGGSRRSRRRARRRPARTGPARHQALDLAPVPHRRDLLLEVRTFREHAQVEHRPRPAPESPPRRRRCRSRPALPLVGFVAIVHVQRAGGVDPHRLVLGDQAHQVEEVAALLHQRAAAAREKRFQASTLWRKGSGARGWRACAAPGLAGAHRADESATGGM
jgi:trans-L-3-hydroxyproline dehydratase